ncbi:MAG: SGNH/GDSL hydrolase family protein [Oscillospiraceae bacterium]|nr:SGNH/GDSL hydrolase family protein [Oscillospiraceae bacterium]
MKKKNNLFYGLWSYMILLCVILVVFAFIFVSCSAPSEAGSAPPAQNTGAGGSGSGGASGPAPSPGASGQASDPPAASPSQSPDLPPPTRLAETEDMGQDYIDRFIFLGDSTTFGMGAYGVVSTDSVWTPLPGTLTLNQWSFTAILFPDTGEELLIPDAVEIKKPEYLMITLGVNGVSFMDEEYFKSEYTSLVNTVAEKSPGTKIILNSIFPVAASYKYQGDINNEKVNAANEWIEQIARDTGTRYLASNSVLFGADGYLPESYQNGDGLHLTKESFELVFAYIRTHGYI